MRREERGRAKLGVLIAASLWLTSACGGKSTRGDTNGDSGGASQVSSGGEGLVPIGGESGGATQVNSGGAGLVPIGGSAGGAGGAATFGTSANAGSSCLLSNGDVPAEARKCLVDSDCATLTINTCCNEDRVFGVAKYPDCTITPTRCDPNACDKPLGFVTDDGSKTLDRFELGVNCQSEQGVRLCRSLVLGSSHVPCGGTTCGIDELCVHLSERGGPAPRCFPLPNDGVCPPESEYAADCNGGPGCRELLLAPAPYCAPVPPSCRTPMSCACVPPDLCRAPQVCALAAGTDVYCHDLSP